MQSIKSLLNTIQMIKTALVHVFSINSGCTVESMPFAKHQRLI